MGRLGHDPHIQHFSHLHLLELSNPQTLNTTTSCSACKLQPSGLMYTCKPCNFTLHVSCTQMPQLITHPSHPAHSLSLVPTPIYPAGIFNCDGCGRQGHGFSYHCTHCDFDLHILCATKPLTLIHQSHPHQLQLTFDPPYYTKGFSCDICKKVGSAHWLYRCSLCEFDAHLDCAANLLAQPIHTQHQYSLNPGAINQMQHGNRQNAMGMNNNQFFSQRQSMGALPLQNNSYNQAPAPAAAAAGTVNPLMDALVQGLVQGAAEQFGQTIVQSLINDGGNNCDPANDSGGDLSVNGIFGDSGTQN
ncbi:hypothetical protein KPL71_008220 [Citrus sinensis]|uniref:Uncharacterized protein n=1 Tax=Citrus sinensis TaxID=2711 RepID=A0ACB8M561_CITSI|nr:hypothetical protein KPL71_008220 [Citrus sinensis]